MAEYIKDRCAERQVSTDVWPIDEIGKVHLDRYPGLIVVLPAQLEATPADSLRPVGQLLGLYRSKRPLGLDWLLQGRCQWFEAGVVQVVGLRGVMGHPVIKAAMDQHKVCARHLMDVSQPPIDVFRPYAAGSAVLLAEAAIKSAGDTSEEPRRLWRYIRTWGVTDIRDVPELRKCIEECRNHYENPRFPALYRPVSGIPGNRLYFLLEQPDYKPSGAQKAWAENGARVWRYVNKQLLQIVPTLARPGERDRTKGAQRELRELYLALCPLDAYIQLVDQSEWPSFS
ncbi:MAG TPA: hypothetical protein VIY28_15185 [Pseudonocardiaceae bacterium]